MGRGRETGANDFCRPNGTPLRNSHVPITECQDGSFCCGYNNTNCCSQSQGSFIVDGQVTTSKPSLSSTSSFTASATSSAIASTSSKSSSNTGAIAGGVVGVVVGLLLVLGALWFFLRRRKGASADSDGVVQQSQRPQFSEMESTEQQRHELVGSGVGYKKVRQSNLGRGMVEVPERYELDAGLGPG